jgi:hypothetical protein
MALSDQLTKLAARAKEVEDRADAAKAQAKTDLEQDVKKARESAQTQAEALRAQSEKTKGAVSDWWAKLGQDWNKQIDSIRREVDKGRTAHDIKHAQRVAERADEDASFAIDYAYAALVEAEYAVLDAYLAHKQADELQKATSNS